MRLGTANLYADTMDHLTQRQSSLSKLQERLSSGKRINRASDDPAGMAQAERTTSRINRMAAEQKALSQTRSAMSLMESSLGNAQDLLLQARELMVSANTDTLNVRDKQSIATQLKGIRDQLLTLANRQDANALPIFGGQGSIGAAFSDTPTGVIYNGTRGQPGPDDERSPVSLDGQALFMNTPQGNGQFTVQPGSANAGSVWTDPGNVTSVQAFTGHDYQIQFSTATGRNTYTVVDSVTGQRVSGPQNYQDGQAIAFDGLTVTVRGQPQDQDVLDIRPSLNTTIFSTLDNAITSLQRDTTPLQKSRLLQSLAEVDTTMDTLSTARGTAGQMLNRIDAHAELISSLSTQLQGHRSTLEDTDMVAGISDFQNEQTAYEAALRSYAQINKLSLFQFIG